MISILKSRTLKSLENKILFENNDSYRERWTAAHFEVTLPQNESKHPNLLKKFLNSKSTTSKTLVKKILLENNNSYREKGHDDPF